MAIVVARHPSRLGRRSAGLWLTQDGDVKVKVSHCGANVCGTIAWLKEPNDNGKPKVDNNNAEARAARARSSASRSCSPMKADGADKWSGQVYNAEDGKTYSGNFTLAGAEFLRAPRVRDGRIDLQDQDLDANRIDRPHVVIRTTGDPE